MCYIFEKPRAQGCQIWHSDNYDKEKEWDKYKDKDTDKDKYTEKDKGKVQKRPYMCHIFEKQMAQGYKLWHSQCIISASSESPKSPELTDSPESPDQ